MYFYFHHSILYGTSTLFRTPDTIKQRRNNTFCVSSFETRTAAGYNPLATVSSRAATPAGAKNLAKMG
jgi:hypothetical protein